MRSVSLLPSATEIVDVVGARDGLVGVSHECDHPAGVETLPRLTRVRTELPRPSALIDAEVRKILEGALTVYEVDVDGLREARPDVIVTQDLCDVCAVSIDDVRKALAEAVEANAEIVSLSPTRLGDVWNDVRAVGTALGRAEEGERAAAELERRIAELAARTAALGSRPTVLTVEWIDPVMIGGTWMPELADAAGGTALVTKPGEHAPTLSRAELEALDPDVVLIKPCGFELERTREEAEVLARTLPLESWRAAKGGRVYVADGNAYFNRPGPRLVESAEILAACLHPESLADLGAKHAAAMRRVLPDGTWAEIDGAAAR
ncbi:MAG: ABC transporter substrate-binding protein [Planctomycetota bacterium]